MEKYDDILFEILKESKTLPGFLDVVFGFLSRRSDFYHVSQDSNIQIGFEKGVADCLVRQAFYKWQDIYGGKAEAPAIEDVATTVEVTTDEITLPKEDQCRKQIFDCSDSYNGAQYESYSWSQTITDVDIKVIVPENIRTKDLVIEVLSNKLSVQLKFPTNVTLLQGDLCQKCKQMETFWSLDQRKSILEIHLEKDVEMWWNCLIATESKLDLTKMDCSRPFHELSEEAQAKIEELTWNQEQKRLGKMTSDEISLRNTLKKSWDVQGSPFQGDFNPDSVLLN